MGSGEAHTAVAKAAGRIPHMALPPAGYLDSTTIFLSFFEMIFLGAAFGFAFVGFASVEEASAVVNAAPLTVNGAATTVEFRLSKVRSEKKPRGEGGEGGGASERKGGDAPRKRKPRVRKPKKIAPNSVWLKGVPEDATDEDITDALSSFGTVVSVDHQNGRDFAFAVFETPESMGGAVSSSGSVSIAGNTIVVQERTGKRPVGQEAAEGV